MHSLYLKDIIVYGRKNKIYLQKTVFGAYLSIEAKFQINTIDKS